MSLSSHSLRLVAAVLAMVGLLARPARAVVLCPMQMPAAAESVTNEHAGHEGHEGMVEVAPNAPADAEHPSDAPAHEICPDLAHCAVAAPPSSNALDADAGIVRSARVVAAQNRPASEVPSLEPPPPKRS